MTDIRNQIEGLHTGVKFGTPERLSDGRMTVPFIREWREPDGTIKRASVARLAMTPAEADRLRALYVPSAPEPTPEPTPTPTPTNLTFNGDFNDSQAADGKTIVKGAQYGSIYQIVNPQRPEPVYRLAGQGGVPALRGRRFVGEFVVRGGETHDDGSARCEAGISSTTQRDKMPKPGEEWWIGLCFNLAAPFRNDTANNVGIVFHQHKGQYSDPFLSLSNVKQDTIYLRKNDLDINLWNIGERFSELQGNWLRFVFRVVYKQDGGEVSLWYKKGAGALVPQDLSGGGRTWRGQTILSSETEGLRLRHGQYANRPYSSGWVQRIWSGGMQTFCGPNGLAAVTPPEPA